MNFQQAYNELTQCSRELWNIGSIRSLVSWDQQVNMPAKGIAHRAEMLSYLAQEMHRKSTDPRLGELLAAAGTGPVGARAGGQRPRMAARLRSGDQAAGGSGAAPRRADRQANTVWQEAPGQRRLLPVRAASWLSWYF